MEGVGAGFTTIKTEFDLIHPWILVSVKVYVVVTPGLTDGFDEVEIKPVGLLVHEQVLPATEEAPIETEEPLQIVSVPMTAAAGKRFTVTKTELDLTQPLELVSVRAQVVETVGETIGFGKVDVKPTGELTQEQVLPATEVPPIDEDAPMQMAVLAITEAVGKALTVRVIEFDFTQPLELVSVRV